MLKSLSLENVGPASIIEMENLGNRFNIITGDNGMGKTFLLDVAWWALTRTWNKESGVARPSPAQVASGPKISYTSFVSKKSRADGVESRGNVNVNSVYNVGEQKWNLLHRNSAPKHLVVYARANGSFSVFNPTLRSAYSEGEELDQQSVINKLVIDWTAWQTENNIHFQKLTEILKLLSESESIIKPGTPRRLTPTDENTTPTILATDGDDVPITHLSSGVRRIVTLAYFIVKTYLEHIHIITPGSRPINDFVFLIDELDLHLHPKWQRQIMGGLRNVRISLQEDRNNLDLNIQIIATTHSPLVLASLEPYYSIKNGSTENGTADKDDPKAIDSVWDFDVIKPENGTPKIEIKRIVDMKRGDAAAWMRSDAFELKSSYAIEIEKVLNDAKTLMRATAPDVVKIREVDKNMERYFPETSPALAKWKVFFERTSV